MRLINTETLKLEEFHDDSAPPYAILSHTWGPDSEELTFSDVQKGINKIPDEQENLGLTKFRKCCKQAQADSLGYAWIDTCCIDKKNLVELGEAINSMFRWYNLAKVCYAYLSDVPNDDDPSDPGSKFRTSRWFKRGWTLQELLAPKHLRFYNSEWRCIGTKGSRCIVIQEITLVPRQFLLGVAELHAASVAQRLSWAAQRETKRAEDLAYCLLGIFGITMPMIYGEGGREAFFRLQEQIMRTTRDDSILAWGLNSKLSMSNPPKSIGEDTFIYGDILAASPSDFADSGRIVTREQATNPLHSLDIFGGSLRIYLPLMTLYDGTYGILSCGPESDTQQIVAIPLAKISSAATNEYVRPRGSPSILHPKPSADVLPELIHIKKDGQKNISTKSQQYLFYDVDLFAKIGLEVIDVAPSDCWDGQLPLISPTGTNQILIRARQGKKESLDFVIIIDFYRPGFRTDQLCCMFICHRETTLDEITGKFQREILEAIQQTSASNQFLHLSIELEPMEGNITSITPKAITSPPGCTNNVTMLLKNFDIVLESISLLRERKKNDTDMMKLSQKTKEGTNRLRYIEDEREAIEREYKRLEAKRSRLVEEEQLKIQEMRRLEEKQGHIRKIQNEIAQQVIKIQKLLKESYHTKGCEDGWTPLSSAIEMGDIELMALLFEPTDVMDEDKRWVPWITAAVKGNVDEIRSLLATDEAELEHKDGIFRRTPLGWASMNGHRDVVELLLDTNRVDICSEDNQGQTPLHWALERGDQDILQLMLQRDQPMLLRTLSGHRSPVYSVAFSHDSKLILSGSLDKTVRLWDSTTSECLHIFLGHTDHVSSVAFSHDSKLLLSGSSDTTIKIWDGTTRKFLYTLEGHTHCVYSVAFSHDSKLVASGSFDKTIRLWDSVYGTCLHVFNGHNGKVYSVAFSHDSTSVASGSGDGTIKLWDSTTGECLHTFKDPTQEICSVAFSHDSALVASGSFKGTVSLWASTTGELIHTLPNSGIYDPHPVGFSHDSKMMVLGTKNGISLWDVSIAHDVVTSLGYQESFAAVANEST